jgi:hypothetical protein
VNVTLFARHSVCDVYSPRSQAVPNVWWSTNTLLMLRITTGSLREKCDTVPSTWLIVTPSVYYNDTVEISRVESCTAGIHGVYNYVHCLLHSPHNMPPIRYKCESIVTRKLSCSIKAGNFLTSWEIIAFSRKLCAHERDTDVTWIQVAQENVFLREGGWEQDNEPSDFIKRGN